ncbi:polyprenyl synthetase family protein [Amycolatopsis anabasis]|uniref:polyprenyl synthetase family protein n=1 Tax=Amycolatopsis anabasis TaxID=1840409 RepID=UPI00131CA762|nr:polyprenyl synthetase family protein [Amycolatopsis anabasis]
MTATELLPEARSARQVLADARALMDPAVRAAVGRLPEPVQRVAGYHFGWLDACGGPAEAPGAKAVRPALALLSASAVGGSARAAVPGAVGVELVHNFSLLHDDVMDGDRFRHHRPTVWVVFGVPAAVLAGDALWALALRVLDECGATGAATRMLTTALEGLVAGQSADTDFERRTDVTVEQCRAMAAGKTGALLGCACALGALFGGGSRGQITCLAGFGEQLGMAFQLVDDLLGIWGDPAVTGKPIGSDVASRKKSLPVVFALSSGTPAGEELAALYRLERPLTHAEVTRAADLVEQAGGRLWAQAEAGRLSARALTSLRSAAPLRVPAAEMSGLLELITHRTS